MIINWNTISYYGDSLVYNVCQDKYSGVVNHILISIPKFPILQIDKGVARKCTQN